MKSECGEFMNGCVRIYRPTNRKLVLSVRKLLSDLCDLCVNNFTGFAHFSLRSNIDFWKLLSTRNCSHIEGISYCTCLIFSCAKTVARHYSKYVCKITVNNKLVFATSVQIFAKQHKNILCRCISTDWIENIIEETAIWYSGETQIHQNQFFRCVVAFHLIISKYFSVFIAFSYQSAINMDKFTMCLSRVCKLKDAYLLWIRCRQNLKWLFSLICIFGWRYWYPVVLCYFEIMFTIRKKYLRLSIKPTNEFGVYFNWIIEICVSKWLCGKYLRRKGFSR